MTLTATVVRKRFPDDYENLLSISKKELWEIAKAAQLDHAAYGDQTNWHPHAHKALPCLVFLELEELQQMCRSLLQGPPYSKDEQQTAIVFVKKISAV